MTSTSCPLGGARAWKDDEPLECVSVVPDGPDVISLVPGALRRLVRVPPRSVPDARAAGPRRPDPPHLHDLLKPVAAALDHPDGEGGRGSVGTRWMLENLRPGMRVKAIGPGGIFVPDVPADRSS